MIYDDCIHYCGDDDCNKCSKHGYIFSCDGCDDYTDFYGKVYTREEDDNGKDKQRNCNQHSD